MKKFLVLLLLVVMAKFGFSQNTQRVVVYDSPDHTEWHVVEYSETEFAPHEFDYNITDTSWNDGVRRFNDSINNLPAIEVSNYLKRLLERSKAYQDSLKAVNDN